MNTNKLILGVVGGLLTGAVLGVLFAPESGKNTRKKIKDKSKELKDTMKNDFDNAIQKIEDKYQNIAQQSNELVQDGKTKAANEMANKN